MTGHDAPKYADIELRFGQRRFLELHEIDAIRDYCQIRFRSRTTYANPNGMFTLEELQDSDKKAESQVVYTRLTHIADYIWWLANLLTGECKSEEMKSRIAEMVTGIKARRPEKKSRNVGLIEKGLNEKQIELLFEIFRPDSELNPFDDWSVKIRNRLMFLMLYHLGLRGGELLNIRIRDIDFIRNQLVTRSARNNRTSTLPDFYQLNRH